MQLQWLLEYDLISTLRNHDKMKDDVIAQLSDQVMALTARMQGM